MKPIETYKCTDCNKEWGLEYATWETPECTNCGDHGAVIETTDQKKKIQASFTKAVSRNGKALEKLSKN